VRGTKRSQLLAVRLIYLVSCIATVIAKITKFKNINSFAEGAKDTRRNFATHREFEP